jgi:hypothetical protein
MKQQQTLLTIGVMAIMFARLCLAPTHAHAEEVPVKQCPPRLSIKQKAVSPIEDGWKIINNEKSLSVNFIHVIESDHLFKLMGVDIQNEMKTPNDKKNLSAEGDHVLHYDYSTGADYVAVCEYDKSKVVAVQKIPNTAVRCEVSYEYEYKEKYPDAPPFAVKIKCFDTPRTKK